jgi:hypothetical protein
VRHLLLLRLDVWDAPAEHGAAEDSGGFCVTGPGGPQRSEDCHRAGQAGSSLPASAEPCCGGVVSDGALAAKWAPAPLSRSQAEWGVTCQVSVR